MERKFNLKIEQFENLKIRRFENDFTKSTSYKRRNLSYKRNFNQRFQG